MKAEAQEHPLNTKKQFFTVAVSEHWLKEVVEPPILEMFKSHLEMVLGNQI